VWPGFFLHVKVGLEGPDAWLALAVGECRDGRD
jgi:hypothetical protein